jgi:hypothetical protein
MSLYPLSKLLDLITSWDGSGHMNVGGSVTVSPDSNQIYRLQPSDYASLTTKHQTRR